MNCGADWSQPYGIYCLYDLAPPALFPPISYLLAKSVTKHCKFTGFGAMDVTKPYKLIGFGAAGDDLWRSKQRT